MTPKRKSVLFCLCLVRNGTKKTGRNGIGIEWFLFYSSPSCDKKTLLSRTKDKNSFRFSSSLLSCSLLLTLSVRNLHHQIPFLFFFLQELFFLYSLYCFTFILVSLSLSLSLFLSLPNFKLPFPTTLFLNYYLF